MRPTTPTNSGLITNDLNELNFALDGNTISINNPDAVFVEVKYKIQVFGSVYMITHLMALKNGLLTFSPGKNIQRYLGLPESKILEFFTNLKLDIAPALVDITIQFQSGTYAFLSEYGILNLKFHAGRSTAIPENNEVVYRSLNYNSILPLAYRFSSTPVDFIFQEKTLTFDKSAESSIDHVFQMLFFQKYHYANASQLPVGFSSGFSSGFATENALVNANPFYRYKEAYFNRIESDYKIVGVNFPLEPNCINVFWLDENNLFQSIKLSGNKVKTTEVINFINENSVRFSERKAGAIKKKKLKVNTGWLIQDEIYLLDSLLEASRIWLVGDDIAKRIEAAGLTQKLDLVDEARELNQYVLEFETNE